MKLFFAGFAVAVIPWIAAGFVWWVVSPKPETLADDDPIRWREGGVL